MDAWGPELGPAKAYVLVAAVWGWARGWVLGSGPAIAKASAWLWRTATAMVWVSGKPLVLAMGSGLRWG